MLTRFLAIMLFVFFAINTSAQSIQQRKTDSVYQLVKKYIKTKNAAAIHELTSPGFKQAIPLANFQAFLLQDIFSFSQLKSDSLISFQNNVKASYRLQFDKADRLLSISLDKNDKLDYFQSLPYVVIRNKTALAASSNPLLTAQDKKVDSIARSYIQKSNTVGLSIGIIRNGKASVYNYGETAKGNKKLPDGNTLFEVGSLTKTFTATLLAYYVNKGVISLNDPITKFLPAAVAANPALAEITLVNLSDHTSGLPSLPPDFTLQRPYDEGNPYKYYTKQMLYDYLQKCTLKNKPGEKFAYSNLGAGLLGVILEKVSGKSFEQMVAEVITQPLGMKSTVQHLYPMLTPRFAPVYDEVGNPTSVWDFDALASAGALRSSTNDLVLYALANMNSKDITPLYKAINLTHQVTVNDNDAKVGLGWFISTINGVDYYFHGGGTGGSSSFFAFNKAKNLAVVILSNAVESTDPMGAELIKKLQ